MSVLEPTPRLVILDVDGTLCDSAAFIVQMWEEAHAEAGVAVPPADLIRSLIGLSLPESIAILAPEADAAARERVLDEYRTRWRAAPRAAHQRLFPGVPQTLQVLRERGYWLALATGKSRRGLRELLEDQALTEHFVATRTADDARSKPHPEMLDQLLEECGLGPDEAVMVGDTTFDLEMARAAGMRSIAALYGAHPPARLRRCEPTATLAEFREIEELLPAAW